MTRMKRTMRFVAPISLLILLCWLMVGCVYIPTFNQVQHPPGFKDLRNLVGTGSDGRPIAIGKISRPQVIALLGQPPLETDDGMSIGYVVDERYGYWLWPLCFSAEPVQYTSRVIRLDFDDHQVLSNYSTGEAGQFVQPTSLGFDWHEGGVSLEKAAAEVNHPGKSPLLRRRDVGEQ